MALLLHRLSQFSVKSPKEKGNVVSTAVHHYTFILQTLSPHQWSLNVHDLIYTPSLPDAEVCHAVSAVKFTDSSALTRQRVKCDKQMNWKPHQTSFPLQSIVQRPFLYFSLLILFSFFSNGSADLKNGNALNTVVVNKWDGILTQY